MNFDNGSFRDPSGQVFLKNEKVYRTINHVASEKYLLLKATGVLKKLIQENWLIDTREIEKKNFNCSEEVAHIVQHKKLELITYPYEWTPVQLKTAALFHLEFQLRALELNWTLSDATAYNVQFDTETGKPVFIDLLSLTPYIEGAYWLGQNQFCEQFLNPLLLSRYTRINCNQLYRGSLNGIPNTMIEPLLGIHKYFNPTLLINVVLPAKLQKKSLSQRNKANQHTKVATQKPFPKSAYISLLKGLKRFITNLNVENLPDSIWSKYAQTNTYTNTNQKIKEQFIADFCSTVAPDLLWDIGCNCGTYSEIAMASGAKRVIGLDNDITALNTAFITMTKKGRPFVPLYFDATNPSPNSGWLLKERKSLFERGHPDAIIALAVIHHLVIRNNIPIESCIPFFLSIADQGVIEFVGKGDETVAEMLSLREDIFPKYNYSYFKQCLIKNAEILREECLPGTDRVLVWYEKI